MSAQNTPPRLRSSLSAVDIEGFFQAVQDALNLHLQSVKWPVGVQPVFVHGFPQERLATPDAPFDVITFSVGGAEMAASSNDGSRVPLKPQIREIIDSTTKSGFRNRVMAWKEEVAAVFTIWSKTNAYADAMVSWFHQFLMTYAHVHNFFMARGVDRFFFLKRGQDQVETLQGQELYKRTLVYQIRIEYVLPIMEMKTLESVTLNVGIGSETDTITLPPPQP